MRLPPDGMSFEARPAKTGLAFLRPTGSLLRMRTIVACREETSKRIGFWAPLHHGPHPEVRARETLERCQRTMRASLEGRTIGWQPHDGPPPKVRARETLEGCRKARLTSLEGRTVGRHRHNRPHPEVRARETLEGCRKIQWASLEGRTRSMLHVFEIPNRDPYQLDFGSLSSISIVRVPSLIAFSFSATLAITSAGTLPSKEPSGASEQPPFFMKE